MPTRTDELLIAFDLGTVPPEIPPERDDSTAERLYRAEVGAYYLRHDEVNEILDGTILTGEDLARAECIRAELAIARARVRDAENHGTNALLESSLAGWADLELRARLILVRAAVRAGRFEEARAELPGLRRDLVASGNELRIAICDYLMGFVCIKAGEYGEAETLLELSLVAFRRIGVTRWSAWCLSLLGVLHTDLHDFEAAGRSLAEAEAMAAEMGCVAGMLTCRTNLARARIASGRIDEAIVSLRDALAWVTSEAQVVPAMNARLLLAFSLGYQGQRDEAGRIAGDLVAMAREIRNREFELHGQILAAWVNGHTDGLRSLVALGLHSDHERTAWLYLADIASRPDEAATMLEHALSIEGENGGNPWDRLADRVRGRIQSSPLQYAPGRLVIDLTRGLPNFIDVMNAVRRFLITAALEQADGNQTQAAALVGLTRSVFHDHVCRSEGRPTRPPRTSSVKPEPTE